MTLRALTRNRGFSTAAILSLALGIGLTTAVYSILDALLLKPFPVEKEHELVNVYSFRENAKGYPYNHLSFLNSQDLLATPGVFSSATIWTRMGFSVALPQSSPESMQGQLVDAQFFSVLGIQPTMGRFFQKDDPPSVTVLSWDLWTSHFASDPGIIGRQIRIDRRPFTVIGVAPEKFTGLTHHAKSKLWVPLADENLQVMKGQKLLNMREIPWLSVTSRLSAGMTAQSAEAALKPVAAYLADTYPEINRDYSVGIIPLPDNRLSTFGIEDVKKHLAIALGLVGFVFLMCCANVANLMLAWSASRFREFSVRTALGASRRRLMGQLLFENSILCLAGSVLGLFLAQGLILLATKFPTVLMADITPEIDGRIVLFVLALSIAAVLLAGMIPALRATRMDLNHALVNRTNTGDLGGTRLRGFLISLQIAMCSILIFGALLFGTTLKNLQTVDIGYEENKLLIASLDLAPEGYTDDQGRIFYTQLLERLRNLPGVVSVDLALNSPLNPIQGANFIRVNGQSLTTGNRDVIDFNIVSPGFFETVGLPLLRGRYFSEQDQEKAPAVILINEEFARQAFPHQDAVGRSVEIGRKPQRVRTAEVIGVVKDARIRSVSNPVVPIFYHALNQSYTSNLNLILRTQVRPEQMFTPVREAFRNFNPDLPILNMKTLEMEYENSIGRPRTLASLAGSFSILATLIAAIGLLGLVTFQVTRRRQEIGIRMALGAQSGNIRQLILGYALRLTVLGVGIGVGGVLILARILESMLYGVTPLEPGLFALMLLSVVLIAVGAAWFPVRRAVRIDPAEALRTE